MTTPLEDIRAFKAIDLGHETDTRIARVSAGVISVGGQAIGGTVFDVRSYGTNTTPGTTDMTTIVQATITAANAAGGGVVLLQPEIYLCDTLAMLSNVTLQGTDKYASVIKLQTAETNMITATSKTSMAFRNLTLQGSNTIPPDPAVERLVYLITCSDITVENCHILNSEYGFHLETCSNVNITGNDFENMLRDDNGARGYGVLATTASYGINVSHNYFNGVERHCVYLTSGTGDSIIAHNVAVSCNGACFVTNSTAAQGVMRNILITGNTVKDLEAAPSGTDDLYAIITTGEMDGVAITNNTIYNNEVGGGIFTQNGATAASGLCKNVEITGNVINGTESSVSSTASGIQVINGSKIKITNNHIKAIDVVGGNGRGISVSFSGADVGSVVDDILIANNSIDTGKYNIAVAGTAASHATNVLIYGNHLTNATTAESSYANVDYKEFDLESSAAIIDTIELGHATDTTLARAAAGRVTVQEVEVATGTPTVGNILYGDGTTWQSLAAGTDGYHLKANGAAAPSWHAGTQWKSYTISDAGNSGSFYVGGHYNAPAAHEVLTIGGTVTRTLGTAGQSHAAHAFCVASGAGGTDLVLTVTGVSITDAGVKNDSDSEVIVADTDAASTNEYFETTKKWLGQITYTLTGAAGAFTFNYGFCKYEDFGNSAFTLTDLECTGKAGASETGLNIELLHHASDKFVYSAAAFDPNATAEFSLATDHGTNNDVAAGEYFAWKRAGLTTAINGANGEGLMFRVTTAVNNSIDYLNFHIGVFD